MRRTLKINNRGEDVLYLTGKLIEFGVLRLAGPISVFTLAVKIAVLDFQARHLDPTGNPLVVDGIVGPLTWWALEHPEMQFDPVVDLAGPMDQGDGSDIGYEAVQVAFDEKIEGAREQGANNSGPWVRKYANGLVDLPSSWCALLVSYCFMRAGEPMPFRYTAGARDLRNQCKRNGWTFDLRDHNPAPGDLAFWWRGRPEGWMGHAGMVAGFEHGILYTIEGNKGPFPAPLRTFSYVASRMEKLLGFARVQE